MPEPHLRASDADRAAVADVLGTHMSAGRLTVAEYDDRLARAYAARTYGELDELTADLPALEPAPAAASAAEPAPGYGGCGGAGWAHTWTAGWGPWAGGAGTRAAWAGWVTTAAIVLTIWAFTMIASGGWIYPWPLWVIGPWAVVLLRQTGGGRDRGRDRQRHRTTLHPGSR
jgi:Domain of unknown function (DUF1707)